MHSFYRPRRNTINLRIHKIFLFTQSYDAFIERYLQQPNIYYVLCTRFWLSIQLYCLRVFGFSKPSSRNVNMPETCCAGIKNKSYILVYNKIPRSGLLGLSWLATMWVQRRPHDVRWSKLHYFFIVVGGPSRGYSVLFHSCYRITCTVARVYLNSCDFAFVQSTL